MNQINQLKPALHALGVLALAVAAAKGLGVNVPFVKVGFQNLCLFAATAAWIGSR